MGVTTMQGKSAMVFSYYQPWVYGGAERFTQLVREELRQGRSVVFVYLSDAGDPAGVLRNAALKEYRCLALYRFVPPASLIPVSTYARDLSGDGKRDLIDVLKAGTPRYMRLHHPVSEFAHAIGSALANGHALVYDIMDLWEDFDGVPWGDRATSMFYVANANAVTAVTKLLVDCLPERSNKHIVPNALDPAFLRQIAPPSGKRNRIAGEPKRVLYMGTMWGTWFDWDLIRRLTYELRDHDFTFIGSTRPAPEEVNNRDIGPYLEEIAGLPHVRVVDEVSHDELVPWLRWADVGLIPFLPGPLTSAVSPLKVYEYLGAGATVVASEIPDIRSYPGVAIASDTDEFMRLTSTMDGAMLGLDEANEIALFCAQNTWTQRIAQLDEIVGALNA